MSSIDNSYWLPPKNFSTTTTMTIMSNSTRPSSSIFPSTNDESDASTASFINSTTEEDEEELSEYKNPYILPWPFQVVYIVAFAAMVLVAAGGNLIVVWLVVAHKRMRTVTNYFLVNLAVADALISIVNTLFNFLYMLHSDWIFGRHYCKFTLFIAPCTICASVFTFMAIAIDRYMAIIHPLKPRLQAMTVLYVIGAIWTASIIISLPNLLYADTHTWLFRHQRTRTVCYIDWPDGPNNTSDFAYNVFLIAVNYFVPLSALAVTYAIVGKQLWGSEAIGERTASQLETIRSKRKVVKMMIVVVVIFAICWLPQHLYFIIGNVYSQINSFRGIQHVYLIIYWIAMSNSMYNPIMYCWMNARFRNGFRFVFRFLPCIKWQSDDSLGLGRTKMVRISASNGMYRMQEDAANRKQRTESGSSREVTATSGVPGHHVKLALTTQMVEMETNAAGGGVVGAPHHTAAAKSFTVAKKAGGGGAGAGGLCRLKQTYKHTGFAKDNY